ncbi:MAG: class I SAM-dependent methyltransferase [Bacteroidia bacterium]|nr:class I SAM-dependent methyltransferase [Bacteroidia bacterium]
MNHPIPSALKACLSGDYSISEGNPLTLVFGAKSEVSAAFDKFYLTETKALPDKYHELKQKHSAIGEGYQRMEKITNLILEKLGNDILIIELGGGVFQQRSGWANEKFPNYIPLDISEGNMNRYSDKYTRCSIAANAEKLPFRDKSVDCILTHTFLEHPTHPEKVVREIARVIKPGGWVVHNDAWFCRWWQRYGVVGLKSFSSMNLTEKLIAISATFTEFPLIRIPPVIFQRLFRLLPFSGGGRDLRYTKLKPNYEMQLGCDEDAASSIDPVDVILYYEQSGFGSLYPLGFTRRLFYRNEPVFLVRDRVSGI